MHLIKDPQIYLLRVLYFNYQEKLPFVIFMVKGENPKDIIEVIIEIEFKILEEVCRYSWSQRKKLLFKIL